MSGRLYASLSDCIQPTMARLPAPGSPLTITRRAMPLLAGAIKCAERKTQAPWELIVLSSLTPLSLVLQGLIDVEKLGGQVGPVSLMTLVIADSGERKSSVEGLFLDPIRSFQAGLQASIKKKRDLWKIKHRAWKAELKRKAAYIDSGNEDEKRAEAEADLLSYMNSEPEEPTVGKLLFDDATSEALFHSMQRGSPSVGLVSSEGGGILSGGVMRDRAKLNAVWSGDPIVIDRKTTESVQLSGGRVTLALMVQTSVLQRYLAQNGEQARGSGLVARFLVAHPKSTQGERFEDGLPVARVGLERYTARISELLDLYVARSADPNTPKKTIRFTHEAKQLLIATANAIEFEINPGRRFEGRGDHASKLADNITRVAALIHCFEYGLDSEISVASLRAAVDICLFCSDDFAYTFDVRPQAVADAEAIRAWLDQPQYRRRRYFKKNDLLQRGPASVRTKVRLNAALEYLETQRSVEVFKWRKFTLIDATPWSATDFRALDEEPYLSLPRARNHNF